MIVREAREIPLFESLGVFTEAPKQKRKPRVISVRPLRTELGNDIYPDEEFDVDDMSDLGDDFSDYDTLDDDLGEDIPDDITDEDIDNLDLTDEDLNGEEAPSDDDTGDLTEDELNQLGDIGDESDSEADNTEGQDNQDDSGAESNNEIDATSDDGVESEPDIDDDSQDNTNTEDSTGEIDATQDGDDTGEDLGGDVEIDTVSPDGTDPTTDPADPTAQAPTEEQHITKDDMRKYELFKRFMNLYNTIQYFSERLGNGLSDNEKFSYATTKALHKFNQLEELVKDYMMLKFQSDSYLQNSFFYEKIKATSLLLLELLKNNKIDNNTK